MKAEDLQDAMAHIDDDLLLDAKYSTKRFRPRIKAFSCAVAGIFAIALIGHAVTLMNPASSPQTPETPTQGLLENGMPSDDDINTVPPVHEIPDSALINAPDGALVKATYPTPVLHPTVSASDSSDEWIENRRQQYDLYEPYKTTLNHFYTESIPAILATQESQNLVYSPLNLYMAMSMLAEVTDGTSRAQILKLLNVKDTNTLRTQTNAIWNANYNDDGNVTSILANSLWLNENIDFRQDTLKTLGNYYYASSYHGKMGSLKFDTMHRNWLNEQTKNFLSSYVNDIKFNPATIMALTSTIFYQAKWTFPFNENKTTEGIFHGTHKDFTCNYQHIRLTETHYETDMYEAVNIPMENSGNMWIFLPKQDLSPKDLLYYSDVVKQIAEEPEPGFSEKQIDLTLPKFDVSSKLKINDQLRELGIVDIFESDADFSPLAKNSNDVFISSIEHAARVSIDEKGCVAASYTETRTMTGLPPNKIVTVTVDRPFLFAITSKVGTPLFVGIVNQPSQ